ncbi:MAG: hypothetical protein WC517_03735 [Patescibacteria group bacterium]
MLEKKIKTTRQNVELDCGYKAPIDWTSRIIWGVFIGFTIFCIIAWGIHITNKNLPKDNSDKSITITNVNRG